MRLKSRQQKLRLFFLDPNVLDNIYLDNVVGDVADETSLRTILSVLVSCLNNVASIK